MKTQKQIISQILKLNSTYSKLSLLEYKEESKFNHNKVEKIREEIKDNYNKMIKYCSMVTEDGFNECKKLSDAFCCDWADFKDAYIN